MNALYYPFHLCHEKTLHLLLANFQQVHFRDFMALQLTPLVGTTAFPDRMGDYHPKLFEEGRIAQGHEVSGSMGSGMIAAVDSDLRDSLWRTTFHEALTREDRFQRGLFDVSQIQQSENADSRRSPVWLQFPKSEWVERLYTVESVKALSRASLSPDGASFFEYGFALIKTAASLIYTVQLCHRMNLVAVTDSSSHHGLLARTCERDGIELINRCVKREGY